MTNNFGRLDAVIGKILDAHANRLVARDAAIGAITHLVVAGEREVGAWMSDPAVFDRWLSSARLAPVGNGKAA